MNTSGDSNITTGSISGSGQTSYVSCIKVNGRPILPPIMSDSLREEMRRYREEAIKVETTLKFKQRLHVHVHPPTRLSQVPMNTTVTLSASPHDNPNIPHPIPPDSDSADSLINKPSSPIPIPAISPSHSNNLASSSETTENKNAFDMLSDHFSIKKHTHSQASQIPAFPSSDEESISSDSFLSEGSSHLNPSVTYIKLEDEQSPIDPPPFFQDPPKDSPKEEDYQSEAMSLISLDNEERLEREEFQKEQEEEEEEEGSIHVSGRSSTETYTIEKNNYSSDSENNNETNFNSINSTRNYFFSPIHSRAEESEEIVFNSENADTVKSKKETRSYFSSPQQSPTTPDNNEVSVISSVASQPSTADSFLSPKSTLSASSKGSSSVRKRFYFSSPESDDPSKGSFASTESNPVRSLNANFGNLDYKAFEASTTDSQRSNLFELDSKSPDVFSSGEPKKSENVTVDYKSMLPTRIPSPKKTPLTPTKVNLMPELQSLVISPKMLEDQREKRGKTPRSPVKKCRNESVQERTFKGSLSLGQVNLSTLQTTLQNMSPSVFKVPPDARSPLLKGVVFMDPLFRPKRELRIPPEVNDPGMQGKFARATAAGKGFLVRRLLKTEKLQMIIQTIRDTVELVLKLYEEVPQLKVRGWKGVNAEDADLCRRLFQQLTGACASFHDVFFKLTTPQRMAIIASDREKMKAKEMKNFLSRSARPTRGPSSKPPRSGNSNLSKRKISTATVKCLERRMSALHS